jgi:YD repeat-containing protein
VATVDPNTGNLALYQPLDFRQSQASSNNADDFARLAAPYLVYNSNTLNVQPLGEITPTLNYLPSQILLYVSWNNGAYGSATTFQTTGHSSGDTYLLADQYLPGSTILTGLYTWNFKLSTTGHLDQIYNGDAPVISNETSPFGAGWSVAGVDHLYINSNDSYAMWVFGSNAAPAIFSYSGTTGKYTAPANLYGTLVKNADSSYTYTSEHQVKYNFNSSGYLTTVTDPHNLTVSYSYSGGLVSTIQQPDGGVTTFSYNGSNQLTQLSEPGGRAVSFAYDASNNLTSTVDCQWCQRLGV